MLRMLLLAAPLLISLSCGSPYQPQTAIVDPGPPQRVPPTVRVLDPGLTPRAPLRYRVQPGQTEVLYVELVMLRALESNGQGASGGLPPIQLQVQMGPAQPTPEGFIRHPGQLTQVRLSKAADKMQPVAREQLERSLEPLLQLRGWSEMDAQGRIRRSQLEGAQGVPPRLLALLSNVRSALLTIPFPAEPVGVRARWEVDRRVELSGAWIDQSVTYDLTQMSEGTLKLQISANQSATPQPMQDATLDAYQASILGSAVVRLSNFTAYSEAEASSQMRVTTRAQGRPEQVRIDTRTAVRLYPAEEADSFEASGDPSAEEVEPAEDPRKVTDPGKQQLRWLK
ncbi:MAG: hypothetical protein WBG86_23025 [Polyangiales bacterium]